MSFESVFNGSHSTGPIGRLGIGQDVTRSILCESIERDRAKNLKTIGSGNSSLDAAERAQQETVHRLVRIWISGRLQILPTTIL